MYKVLVLAAGIGGILFPMVGRGAEPTNETSTEDKQAPSDNTAPSAELPPPVSSHDPRPTVPSPMSSRSTGVIRQAGIGGPVAYARSSVLELGGGIIWSQTDNTTLLSISPTIGWFLLDNLELSAIVDVAYLRAGGNHAVFVTGLVEPSVHLPLSDHAFVFAGLGVGAAYGNGSGTGLALAPRIGLNFLIGRSGILSPALALNWSSNRAIETSEGTFMAVNTTYGAKLGYTVMW